MDLGPYKAKVHFGIEFLDAKIPRRPWACTKQKPISEFKFSTPEIQESRKILLILYTGRQTANQPARAKQPASSPSWHDLIKFQNGLGPVQSQSPFRNLISRSKKSKNPKNSTNFIQGKKHDNQTASQQEPTSQTASKNWPHLIEFQNGLGPVQSQSPFRNLISRRRKSKNQQKKY